MSVPSRDPLPRYLAPLPRRLEDLALRLAWPIALVNLAGTAFGFWYYRRQLAETAVWLWPVVPDSPLATLFVALSLAAWKLDRQSAVLDSLAFFGLIKLGLWTPYVQLALNGPGGIEPWLYWFLVVSHLGMAAEAFVLHRYADFPVRAVATAAAWYWLNDVVDYFVPVDGTVYHTPLRAERMGTEAVHALAVHDRAAAAAVTLTLLATFLALAARVAKAER